MQPPAPPPNEIKTSDDNVANIKKRRVSVKSKKATNSNRQQQGTREKTVESDAEPVVAVASADLSRTRSPGPYRGKCLYQSRKCENERAVKRNGKPHNLCEEHRSKQNQHQRKFDAKKFSRKRRRGSVSDEDTKNDGDKVPAHRNDGTKHQRTTTEVTTNSLMMPTMRGNYLPRYNTPGAAPLTRLPPIQSPRGPILPPSPATAYTHSGSTRSGAVLSEAYPRGYVGYSEYRTPGAQSPQVDRRPHLPPPQVSQPASGGYSHSELVAASILAQPQSSSSTGAGQTITTPRVLPSLLVPPSAVLPPSLYHRVSGIVPSPAQRFASVVTPARDRGNVLPPLVPFALRRAPTPTPKQPK